MRSGVKSFIMCCSVIAVSGLALAQQSTDPRKPSPPANTPPGAKTPSTPPTAPTPPAVPAMDPMMEAMMKAGTPGDAHKKLDPMAGQFDVALKFNMGPGVPEMTSTGTATNKWILDGRFLEMTFKGDFMGMPFNGMGMLGYNNVSKQYESFWVDSMMTAMMMSTGTVSADGKTFTWVGESDDPMTGKKKKSRSVNRIVDANTYTYEMFEIGEDGKEFKAGELTFTRTGAARPEAPKTPAAPGNTAPRPAQPK